MLVSMENEIMTETMSLDEFHAMKTKRPKHGNRKMVVDGIEFDSLAESVRYHELLVLVASGDIWDLKLQPRITLIDSFVDRRGHKQRPTYYFGDFMYTERSLELWGPPPAGQIVIEDVKPDVKRQRPGKRKYTGLTEAFRIKWKLAQFKYGHIWDFRIERR